jgi:D-alanyl-D-alanine carboxypeptidase
VLLVALVVLLPACGGDGSDTVAPPVRRVARQLATVGAESAIVLVLGDGEEYRATAGDRRPAADQRFRIGSLTKTFTATIVLQLVAEGRLRLSDTLGRYVPNLPRRARGITIRQLLNHRSGLANITDDPSWIAQADGSVSTRPIGVLRYGVSQPPVFAPGTQWRYSNTNYIALGLVIEKVTRDSYVRQLNERILEPLQLDSTELPTTRRLPDLQDAGENPNLAWAAGGLVSNAHDLARFYSALLSGDVLSEESLALMKQTVDTGQPGTADGLGIFTTRLPCGRFWGHNGGIGDYLTVIQASEDGRRVAVLSARGNPTRPPPDWIRLLCPRQPSGSR